MHPLRHAAAALAVASLCLSSLASLAQAQTYPARPVTFVVPFAAGGGTDGLARLLGKKLGEHFGQSFVVDNRAGAGTALGTQMVANAPPDGHTILMGTSTIAVTPTLYRKPPYDALKDLVPVSLICGVPFVLVVNPNLPVHSVADLVKLAKDKPGGLNYGSGGPGAFHHLLGELLSTTTGIKMVHVPYKGGAPALQDLVAGHIQLMFADLAPAMELVRAGKLRALGITTAQRAAAAPEVAPLAEVGLPGFDAAAWQMVLAPAGTPEDIVAKLNAAANAAVADPEMNRQLVALGFNPVGKGTSKELSAYVAAEVGRWGEVVKRAGIAGSQ